MTRRIAALLVGVALLTGCMSIPLSTMWAMRSFEPGDLAAIEPGDVRVATLVEPSIGGIDPDKARLKLTLTPRQGEPEVHVFGLVLSPVQGGPIVPGGHPQWQVLQLDPAGVAAMRALEPRLSDLESHYKGWALNVSVQGLDKTPKHVDTLYFSVRVQLARDQAPLTLFDRAEIEMEREG